MMEHTLKANRITLGTCYYPEQWEENLWQEDLNRMLQNGIKTIRIAEFAWSKIEPEEGTFTYDFYDRFLKLTEETGMKVIFSTPTATPPAWLTNKYPEVLNAGPDGVLYRHGGRRHYNYNSSKYRELCARIVEKSAARYGSHKSIIGWQIDNEINCEKDVFYSESDTIAFRKFLQDQYQTLDKLNAAWGTVFWNQTYTDFREITLPGNTPGNSDNPHKMLDYIRFISNSACRFVKLQSDILKKYKKDGDFITTNGLFGKLDSHRMTNESLDFIMYDSYPDFAFSADFYGKESEQLKDRKWSMNLSRIRAISPNFGIMEQQSGANGWNTCMQAPAPRPGQMTLWTMQSIAHGADFVSYFRWRTAAQGTEIYWQGILDYSNRDNRRLQEVSDIDQKLQRIGKVAGSRYEAFVGILMDYDNIWDAEVDVFHREVDEVSQNGIFTACQRLHTPFDYCFLDHMQARELYKYKVLFYPHASIMTKEMKDKLSAYVNQGGCLVLGCRTGYKDETGKCPMLKLPGLLQELSGTDVLEYSYVSPEDGTITVKWDDEEVEAAVFNDILEPLGDNAVIAGEYGSSYFSGMPGLIKNCHGKGQVYYFGGAFTGKTAEVFLNKLCVAEPYAGVIKLPAECELSVRSSDNGTKYLFVLNYLNKELTMECVMPLNELISGRKHQGICRLMPYEVKVFELNQGHY